MDLPFALDNVVTPALKLLPSPMTSHRAKALLLAIGLQESRFKYRVQMGGGPAHGFWQFEKCGGVRGVNIHPVSRDLARRICFARDCVFEHDAVWQQLATDDILGAVYARLLLFTDPLPLPDATDATGAWEYYLRNWRPGKPRVESWKSNFRQATELIMTRIV